MGPVSVTIINAIVSFCSEHPPSCYTSALQIHNHIISKNICNHIYIYNTHTYCVHIRHETFVYISRIHTITQIHIYIYIYIIVRARVFAYTYIYIYIYNNIHTFTTYYYEYTVSIPVTIIIRTLICTQKEFPSQIISHVRNQCLYTL